MEGGITLAILCFTHTVLLKLAAQEWLFLVAQQYETKNNEMPDTHAFVLLALTVVWN